MQGYKLKSTNLIHQPKVIAIGSSTGGLQALTKIFTDLKDYKIEVPIVITQHMPENFDSNFTTKIEEAGDRKCITIKGGEELENGVIYMAPSDKHMVLKNRTGRVICAIDDGPEINFCKPSVEPLFKSVAEIFGAGTHAYVLTGIGSDGIEGAKLIADKGGAVLAQDKESSVVWGMNAAVVNAGICNSILPLDEIAKFMIEYSFGKISKKNVQLQNQEEKTSEA